MPNLSPKSLKELRNAKTRAQTKYSAGGHLKTGARAPKPINLRLPKEKR